MKAKVGMKPPQKKNRQKEIIIIIKPTEVGMKVESSATQIDSGLKDILKLCALSWAGGLAEPGH